LGARPAQKETEASGSDAVRLDDGGRQRRIESVEKGVMTAIDNYYPEEKKLIMILPIADIIVLLIVVLCNYCPSIDVLMTMI
jgi:hypothetical protein